MKSNHDLSKDGAHLSSFESFPGSQWGRLPACGPYCGPPHFHPATHPDSHQPYCPASASCLLSDLFGNLSWTESASEIEISLLNPQAWLTSGIWMLHHLFNNFPNQRNVTGSLLSARHSKHCKLQHQHKNSASSSLRAIWGPWWPGPRWPRWPTCLSKWPPVAWQARALGRDHLRPLFVLRRLQMSGANCSN